MSFRASTFFLFLMTSSSSSSTNEHFLSRAMVKRRAGRKKFQETRHPIYKGVRQRNGKWVSELRRPNKKSSFWVGTFCSPKMAAVAYDVVALAIRGESATLNFPALAHSFPRVMLSSLSINDIRMMAVEAAEAFTSSDILTSLSPSSSSPSLLCSSLMSEEKVVSDLFWDEEEVFNMPTIIADMAEGLILTPPGMKSEFDSEDYENTFELSLWNYEWRLSGLKNYSTTFKCWMYERKSKICHFTRNLIYKIKEHLYYDYWANNFLFGSLLWLKNWTIVEYNITRFILYENNNIYKQSPFNLSI